MVYYAMPLIMKSENGATQHQLCLNSNQMVVSDNYSNGQLPAPQQPQLINLSNGGNDGSSPTSQTNYTYQLLTSSDHHQQQQSQQNNQATSSSRGASTKQTKSFKCDQCNMTFTTKSAHTSHIKSHAKQQATQLQTANVNPNQQMQSSDPYQCDVCKKTFAVPARLVS